MSVSLWLQKKGLEISAVQSFIYRYSPSGYRKGRGGEFSLEFCLNSPIILRPSGLGVPY